MSNKDFDIVKIDVAAKELFVHIHNESKTLKHYRTKVYVGWHSDLDYLQPINGTCPSGSDDCIEKGDYYYLEILHDKTGISTSNPSKIQDTRIYDSPQSKYVWVISSEKTGGSKKKRKIRRTTAKYHYGGGGDLK